jgi:DNA-binding winged helix-turn-helix (wHTH) protein
VTRSGQRPGQDRVSLAHEPAFALGPLAIEPALRRIVHSDGREEFVEPRVMQVLVALARADGTILSRDDLILSCWEGRIVGEDAINRVMSRLRRLSETLGRGAFRVETITKVGYRLVPEAAPPPRGLDGGPSPAPPRPGTEEAGPALQGPSAAASLGDSGDAGGSSPAIAPPGFSRRATALAAGAAALLLAIAAGLGSQLWKGPAGPVSVAVVGQGDSGSGGLAREIMVDLARLAGVRGSRLTITELPAGAQFVVRIARTRPGNGERLDLSLAAGEGGEVLWSSSLEGNAAGPAALRPQASARIGQVLLCALRRSKDGEMLPPQLLGLYMAACEKMQALPDQQLVTLLQRITDEAPAFAPAWGDLAFWI